MWPCPLRIEVFNYNQGIEVFNYNNSEGVPETDGSVDPFRSVVLPRSPL